MRSALSNHTSSRKKKKKERKKKRKAGRKRKTHFDILIFGKTMAFDLRKINFIASTTTA